VVAMMEDEWDVEEKEGGEGIYGKRGQGKVK
jgi:hypothetical protein